VRLPVTYTSLVRLSAARSIVPSLPATSEKLSRIPTWRPLSRSCNRWRANSSSSAAGSSMKFALAATRAPRRHSTERGLGCVRPGPSRGSPSASRRPRACSQFDWSDYTVQLGSALTRVVLYETILSYSRRLHYPASLDATQASIFEALEEASGTLRRDANAVGRHSSGLRGRRPSQPLSAESAVPGAVRALSPRADRLPARAAPDERESRTALLLSRAAFHQGPHLAGLRALLRGPHALRG
jgi:hypothetical protein